MRNNVDGSAATLSCSKVCCILFALFASLQAVPVLSCVYAPIAGVSAQKSQFQLDKQSAPLGYERGKRNYSTTDTTARPRPRPQPRIRRRGRLSANKCKLAARLIS